MIALVFYGAILSGLFAGLVVYATAASGDIR